MKVTKHLLSAFNGILFIIRIFCYPFMLVITFPLEYPCYRIYKSHNYEIPNYWIYIWQRSYQPEINYFKKAEFEEMSVCPYCFAPTEERSMGDEGWTFCTDGCGCLEGAKTMYKFFCKNCEEMRDIDQCNCNN